VIPTYEGRDSVLGALEALCAQTLAPSEFEAVVVIDGSQDGTREALETFRTPFPIRSLWQENRGRAAAINSGARIARGDLVVLVDDDLVPSPDFLAAHVRAHESGERRGVVGAVRFRLDGSTPPFARYWGARFEDFLGRLEARSTALAWTETYTGAFSIRRADLLGVDGFDEAFDGYGLEDFELALRLSRAGVDLVLCPEAIAYHEYDKKFPAAARDAESRGRSAVIFEKLHPEVEAMEFAPRDLTPPSIPRRLIRYVLPGLSVVLPVIPRLVERSVGALERAGPSWLDVAYTLALEYFFLLGLREAEHDGRQTARASGR
jgi:GT2 family glycosyltransferase